MCCLWHGEVEFFFYVRDRGKGFGLDKEMGKVSSVVRLPWESLCCFVKESCRAVSVVEPKGDALGTGTKQTP